MCPAERMVIAITSLCQQYGQMSLRSSRTPPWEDTIRLFNSCQRFVSGGWLIVLPLVSGHAHVAARQEPIVDPDGESEGLEPGRGGPDRPATVLNFAPPPGQPPQSTMLQSE